MCHPRHPAAVYEPRKGLIDMTRRWMNVGLIVTLVTLLIGGSAVVAQQNMPQETAAGPAPQDASEPPAAPPADTPSSDTAPGPDTQTEEAKAGSSELSGNDIGYEILNDGTILLEGIESDLDILQALIAKIDQETDRQAFTILSLTNATASELSAQVQEIFTAVYPNDEFTVVADNASNTLIIAGPEDLLDEIKQLARDLDDQTPPLELEYETVKLQYIPASEAAEYIQKALEQMVKQRPGGDKILEKIEVIALDRNQSVTVTAPKEYIAQIKQLIAVYDVEPEGLSRAKLLYIPLVMSNAADLADALTEMLTVQGQQAEDLKEKILRLRFTKVGVDGQTEELPELDLEKPLKIVPEPGTNALIIATHDQNAVAIQEIVKLLDNVPIAPQMGIEFFPLKFADAERVAQVLNEMFDAGKELPATPGDKVKDAVPAGVPGEAFVYNVGIHADKRSNTVVVSGRPAQLAVAFKVVEQLDIEGRQFFPKTQFLYLENTDAERVAKVLTDLNTAQVETLSERDAGTVAIEQEKALVLSDLRANALIVMATESKFEELSNLARKLDEVDESFLNEVRLVKLEKTSAANIADKIGELWARKGELRERQELPPDLPVVVADARSNALVIASSIEDYNGIKKLVEDLESQELAPMAMIRMIELENNDAEQLGEMLKQLFDERREQRQGSEEDNSDKVAISSDAATNTMLVASSVENFEEIQNIVAKLDVIPELAGIVQTFVLENADAANVAGKVRELVVEQGLYQPGKGAGNSDLSEERDHVALISDTRSNAIMVSASKPNMAIIEQLIKEMDRDDTIDFGSARIFQLVHADALKVAGIMQQVFDGLESSMPSDSADVFVKPTFIPVEVSNAVIVTGSRDAMARTEELLKSMDQESTTPSAQFEVYTLKHASAVKLAPRIQQMFEERNQGADGERTPMTMTPVESSNSLLCSASAEDHHILSELIEMLDIKSSLNQQLKIFNLNIADAEQASQVLSDLFQSQTEGSDGSAAAIAVQPVLWTNSLLVWASAGQMEDIERMVSKLDANKPTREMRFEVIQLKTAMAEDLATAVEEAFAVEDAADETALILSFFEDMDGGSRELRKLLRQDISIVPYLQTNSLMVMAPPESVDMLHSLIRQLDDIPPLTAIVEVFPLTNANAEQMIETLQQVFEQSEGGSEDGPEVMIEGVSGVAGANVSGLRQALTFAPDTRTNSVIVAGNEQYIEVVRDMIDKLDGQAAEERFIETVRLNNTTADVVATALQDFNEQENARLAGLDETRSVYQLADQAITVVPDEGTNSVLVSVSPRYRKQYMDIVKELDRAPEQVLIEFMLIEVSLEDTFELGMEWTWQDLLFSEKAVQGPNGTIQGPNKDFVVGTDLGALGSGGGFSFTVTGEDFAFLFHALQTAGRAELISRPSLVAEDNAEDARIAILNQVPTLEAQGSDNAGNPITNVNYVDTGITLEVTPHINPDGFIQLELDSTVNNVGPQVQVGDTSSVSIQGTELTTTVTIKDGETVIIGGLIETISRQNEQKVPIVGDIPLIGAMFRTDGDSSSRRELLVVMTATIIRNEEDSYRMSIEQRDLTDIIPDKTKASPLLKKLQVRPGVPPIQDREMLRKPIDEAYGPEPGAYGPVVPQELGLREDAAPADNGQRQRRRVSIGSPS